MAGNRFSVILTAAGEAAFAAAAVSGEPVGFSVMAVGDGGGVLPTPYAEQTGLINEVYRSPLNRLVIADQAKNIIRAEMIIPPQAGGFWLREAAVFNEDGICLAVASLPESYKPLLAEGSGRTQSVNLLIAISSTADVELKADATVILVSVEELERAKNDAKDYTDDAVGKLNQDLSEAVSEAIQAAITQAKRDFWEEENPVGTVRFYAQKVDPNTLYPWSTWVYTGENKSIRVGKVDGSNVGQTGGSDNVTLHRANLPAVQINVNGETSELPAHELTTREAGRHKHQGGMAAPGEAWDGDYIVGSDNDSHRTRNYTSEDGDHTHVIDAPPHKHSTSGKTDNLGEGKSFSVIEAHTLLMCWSRVA
ncbi:phage tail protein [Raoultella ornithinolytica]|uniref:phage tail protein n=1 Tax=Raoultella ornithinolytica TaxID=54291 RepID=UPI00194F439F|nr:phage tail protein [Raoultella ornithinolytica]MBM6479722.1 phage tail protein [Raoultella ornithinolytica]